MKTFRELYIYPNGVEIETISQYLENQCTPPWKRRQDKESGLGSISDNPLCFESTGNKSVAPVALFIFPNGENTLWVSNIVPTEVSELSYDQYNAAIENFFEHIVQPAIEGTNITAELTSNEISVGSIAGAEVENALIKFSNLANKSTGSSHPRDRERWFEFLFLAHNASNALHTDVVIRALIELGWPEDRATALGIQFEFGEGLLSYIQER